MIIVRDMTRMNAFVLRIFLVSFFILFAHCSFEVAVTWSDASERCGKAGLEFKESVLKKEFDVLQGKVFWLGKAIYRRTSDWIEILGCYNVTVANGIKILIEISCITECQIKCSSLSFTYFGYTTHTMCVCSETLPPVKAKIQDCAVNKSSNLYFFYKVYHELVSQGKGGLCTSLTCLNRQNHMKAVNCTDTDKHVAGRCGNDELVNARWGIKYNNILQRCMSKNQLLLSPHYCRMQGHGYEGIESWTNVFRDKCEYLLTKEEGGNDRPVQCLAGQLMQVKGQWKLIKTTKNCDNVLDWFICRIDVVTPSITSKDKTSPSSALGIITITKGTDVNTAVRLSHSAERNTIKMNFISESIRYTTYMYTSKTSRAIGSTGQPNDAQTTGYSLKTIGAVIGGMLGAFALVVVLSILIVYKIRSKRFFKESNYYEDTRQVNYIKTIYEDLDNTRSKNTTTVSTQTCQLDVSLSPEYANMN